MIDEKESYKLLIEKIDALDRKINRLFILLVIIPLVYFLLKYSLISEIEINIFKIEQISFILLVTPVIYTSIFLYSSFLEANKARIKVFVIEMEDDDDFSFNTRYLLSRFNLYEEISNIDQIKKRNSKLLNIAIIIPFYFIMLLLPILFWGYTLYYNFNYEGTYNLMSNILGFISIWIFIASAFNYYYVEKDIYEL